MEDLTFYIILGMILLFLSLIGTVVVFLVYSGAFHTVVVGAGAPPLQEVQLAYHFGRGAYRNCGHFFGELCSLAPTLKKVGIYYDDPKQVEEEKLRWAVGCIVAHESETPDKELLETLQQKGYKLFTLPHVTSVVRTKFPNNTFISFLMAIYKVYPALGSYIQENKLCAHPFLEIYDGPEIHFMVPLARQNDFYVPESLMEDDEEESGDEVQTDHSSDEATPEKDTKKVVDTQPTSLSASISSPSAAAKTAVTSVVAESATMRESFGRDTPLEESTRTEKTQDIPSSSAAKPVVGPSTSQPGSPNSGIASTPEGGSSSEVDSESYEVVKAEDISGQN